MPEFTRNNELTDDLLKCQLAGDLLDAMRARSGDSRPAAGPREFRNEGRLPVIIEGNARFPTGSHGARNLLAALYARQRKEPLRDALASTIELSDAGPRFDQIEGAADLRFRPDDQLNLRNSLWTDHYLFGLLSEATILALTELALRVKDSRVRLVHKIWLNHSVGRFVFESGRTVKCDAARAAFAAAGEGVVWAVADTGVDGSHFHFRTHKTLELPDGLRHMDFTTSGDPLRDDDGHGSHVAGIIAGETRCRASGSQDREMPQTIVVQQKVRESDTKISDIEDTKRTEVSGIAPKCKILSLKVLEVGNAGDVGTLLAALGYIQKINDNGRNLRVHGVNLSLGYTFDAKWFAAGGSPLCVEVDRLVKSGVVVVVAAGNSGYGTVQSLAGTTERASHLATISDPGNSDLAITVGSTHRDSPHSFGVSYFSAKGPTADGRMKPDLVAPGERIVSVMRSDPKRPNEALFHEDTGTSMAAPHVSGAIAAFLSVRREFRGHPEKVKRIFMDSATSLNRRPEFQGSGLIDVMRALQSI